MQYRVLLVKEQSYRFTDGFQLAKSARATPLAIQSHGIEPAKLFLYSSQSIRVLLAKGAVMGVAIGFQDVKPVAMGRSSHAMRVP